MINFHTVFDWKWANDTNKTCLAELLLWGLSHNIECLNCNTLFLCSCVSYEHGSNSSKIHHLATDTIRLIRQMTLSGFSSLYKIHGNLKYIYIVTVWFLLLDNTGCGGFHIYKSYGVKFNRFDTKITVNVQKTSRKRSRKYSSLKNGIMQTI